MHLRTGKQLPPYIPKKKESGIGEFKEGPQLRLDETTVSLKITLEKKQININVLDKIDGYCLCFQIADGSDKKDCSYVERMGQLASKLTTLCFYNMVSDCSIVAHTFHNGLAKPSKMTPEYAIQTVDALYKANLLKASEIQLAKENIEKVESDKEHSASPRHR